MADLHLILPGFAPPTGGAKEVGNKAWNLMLMAKAGLPVPPAFVLPTTWSCSNQPARAPLLRQTLGEGIVCLEAATGLAFGATRRPLLVSVRSGAAVSMPGMMETVLDVGLNMQTVQGLIRLTGNPRLAWDSFRRLVQGYAEVVANLPTAPFDALVNRCTCTGGGGTRAGIRSPLAAAAEAVFRSWDAPKAASYRRMNGIADDAGTALTVQTMVFGNAGGASGAGVGFTRNPATGARELYFDFQFNGQGEDVVAGRQKMCDNDLGLPAVWIRLNAICRELEGLFGDAQDFEFTVQSGVLCLLQARRAKRTDWAAVAIAVDMVDEGMLSPAEGLARLAGIDLDDVVRTSFAPPVPPTLAVGQVASMGAASGAIALDAEAVERLTASGTPAILVRRETVTSDIEGMALAQGILTASGGRTSHAAVVARQLGKVCVVACPDLEIDLVRRECRIGGTRLQEGGLISLDGNTGAVHAGRLKPVIERPERSLATIASWQRAAAAQNAEDCQSIA